MGIIVFFLLLGLEYQRQQLITERQQFHLEQLKAAEFRARQQAHHRLQQEQQQQGVHPPGPVPAQVAGQMPPTMGQQPPQSQAVPGVMIPPSSAGVVGQPPVAAGPPTTIPAQVPVGATPTAPVVPPQGPPQPAGAPVAPARP